MRDRIRRPSQNSGENVAEGHEDGRQEDAHPDVAAQHANQREGHETQHSGQANFQAQEVGRAHAARVASLNQLLFGLVHTPRRSQPLANAGEASGERLHRAVKERDLQLHLAQAGRGDANRADLAQASLQGIHAAERDEGQDKQENGAAGDEGDNQLHRQTSMLTMRRMIRKPIPIMIPAMPSRTTPSGTP